jgi:hypothetical protein
MADFNWRTPLARNLTGQEVDFNFASIATQDFDYYLGTVSDATYTIVLKARYGGMITEATTQCDSGTATATFKINGTPLGGAANAVTSSIQSQTHVASNVYAAGDKIAVTFSSNSSCLGAVINLRTVRQAT